MPTIAISLPNAVTIRDVVHTGTLQHLLEIPDAKIQIYTQNPELPEFDELRISPRVEILPLLETRPRLVSRFLRHIYPLLYYDEFTYLQKVLAGRPVRIFAARAFSGVRRMVGNRRAVRAFGRLLLWASAYDERPAFRDRPDLVIGTRSLVASLEFPFICEAVRMGVPLVTAASSWDNFTTKGFLPFPVERTVVWNRKMAEELEELFGVPAEEIVVAGYPRRALLRDTGPHRTAAQYLRELGMGDYSRFVLYSASYGELTRTSASEPPREFVLLRQVAEQLVPQLPSDTCLLVRLHPYSKNQDEHFFDGLEKVRVFVPGRSDRYVERVMGKDDEYHLAAQIGLSECVVSMASTMTIDALAVGKPVLNVAFEPDGQGDTILRFYEYNHFRDLVRIARIPLAHSAADVFDFVKQCLAGRNDPRINNAAFEDYYVPAFSEQYPRILRLTVEEVLANQ